MNNDIVANNDIVMTKTLAGGYRDYEKETYDCTGDADDIDYVGMHDSVR